MAPSPINWQSFADPVLERLQAVGAGQPRPADSRAALAQSRAQGTAVRSQGMPQLGASGSAMRVRESEDGDFARVIGAINPGAKDEIVKVLSEVHNMYQLGFDASWELDLWGRVRRSIEASDADEAAAAALLAQVQLSVQAEVARRTTSSCARRRSRSASPALTFRPAKRRARWSRCAPTRA